MKYMSKKMQKFLIETNQVMLNNLKGVRTWDECFPSGCVAHAEGYHTLVAGNKRWTARTVYGYLNPADPLDYDDDKVFYSVALDKAQSLTEWLNGQVYSFSIYRSNENGKYGEHVSPYCGRDSSLNPMYSLLDGIYRCNDTSNNYAWLVTVKDNLITEQRTLFADEK